MSNTYKQSAVHVVFAPKYRRALLVPAIRERIEKYIAGKVCGLGHQLIAIYIMPDHVHLLLAISMCMAPATTMQIIKGGSSKWINDEGLTPVHFEWQRGYRWFHVSGDRVDVVAAYIRRQPEHHKQEKFLPEMDRLLHDEGVEFDPLYSFHEPE